ncbi:hypothetical protein BDW62DRAFT_205921 [Aspergillus aurantiobrunneus]
MQSQVDDIGNQSPGSLLLYIHGPETLQRICPYVKVGAPASQQREGKPGRLRAACTQCHAAKVRCSGEKTGCVRCRTLGHDCVYLESRVGKTRGRRKEPLASPRPRDTQSRITVTPDLDNRPLTAATEKEGAAGDAAGSTAPPALSPTGSGAGTDFLNNEFWDVSQGITDSGVLDGGADLDDVDFFQQFTHKDIPETTLPTSWEDTEKQMTEHPSQRLDSAIGMTENSTVSPIAQQSPWKMNGSNIKPNTHTHTLTHTRSYFPPRFATPTGPGGRYLSCSEVEQQENKGVVLVAAEILEHLEGKMCAGVCAIDEVLRTNKEATQRIIQLLKRSDYTRSTGSLMVVVAAAQHVVDLFETACDDLYSSPCWPVPSTAEVPQPHNPYTKPRRRLNSGLGASGTLHPPGIGFGSFLLDPQDQAALSARIIGTELHRTLHMVQSLSTPRQAGCYTPDMVSVTVDGWLQDLKQRLRTLISTVESSERNWSR